MTIPSIQPPSIPFFPQEVWGCIGKSLPDSAILTLRTVTRGLHELVFNGYFLGFRWGYENKQTVLNRVYDARLSADFSRTMINGFFRGLLPSRCKSAVTLLGPNAQKAVSDLRSDLIKEYRIQTYEKRSVTQGTPTLNPQMSIRPAVQVHQLWDEKNISDLTKLTSLESLDISRGVSLPDESFHILTQINSLTCLVMCSSFSRQEKGGLAFVSKLTSLVSLNLICTSEKLNYSLMEASFDLGASWMTTFRRVLLPLSCQGIRAGFFLVFIPSFGEFAIPELMGGDKRMFVGTVVAQYIVGEGTGSLGAAFTLLSCTILLLTAVVLYFALGWILGRRKQDG